MERKAQNAVPGVRTLEEKLLEALAESLKQVCATIRGRSDDILQPLERPLQVGIAFSGGRDSMALLEAAHRLTRSRRWGGLIEGLYALHVNHGISENADSGNPPAGRSATPAAFRSRRTRSAWTGRERGLRRRPEKNATGLSRLPRVS